MTTLSKQLQISVLRTNIDILLMGLAGLSWAGVSGPLPSLMSVSQSEAQARGAAAAWVGSHDGWNDHKRVMETQKSS